ncbi:MAG: hypothetical protein Q4G27_00205 [Flavobacteriaceae bacterium]|nr:hypothetical protein [Flavobacteriaceae bacterium]
MKKLIILLLFSFLFINCTSTTDNKAYTTEYNMTTDENWSIEHVSYPQNKVIYYSNLNTNNFRENINIITEMVGNEVNLDEYIQLSIKGLSAIPNFKIYEREATELQGKPAYFIDYEMEYNQNMQRNLQYFLIENGVAYIITFTSDLEDFEKTKEHALRAMNSFRLNP